MRPSETSAAEALNGWLSRRRRQAVTTEAFHSPKPSLDGTAHPGGSVRWPNELIHMDRTRVIAANMIAFYCSYG